MCFSAGKLDKAISIPVVRGGVQPPHAGRDPGWHNFNSRGAWGSSTVVAPVSSLILVISIPVVRGGVQPVHLRRPSSPYPRFQFPWCVGEFNISKEKGFLMRNHFNSRGAWGSSTRP